MCMTYSKYNTEDFKKNNPQETTVYKLYRISFKLEKNNRVKLFITPPYRICKEVKITRNGYITSDRKELNYPVNKLSFEEKQSDAIYHGIHVYLDKIEAEYNTQENNIIVTGSAFTKDLIGVKGFGESHAVFNKIKVNKKQIKKLILAKKQVMIDRIARTMLPWNSGRPWSFRARRKMEKDIGKKLTIVVSWQ